MKSIFKGLMVVAGFLAVVVVGFFAGYYLNWFGTSSGPGTIEGAALPAEVIIARRDAQDAAADQLGFQTDTQILFGDLHVHTTYSTDAFLWSMPMLGGTGAKPLGEACDFARYCSGLDFWSSNDHAEGLSPRMWREIRDSINQCQAVSGDADDPDLVSFIGYEWTQVGRTPADHYGHKNVIFRDLEDENVSARPIASSGLVSDVLRNTMPAFPPGIVLREGLQSGRYWDFNAFLAENRAVPICDADTPSSELPVDCFETAATPGDLVMRLEDQGLDPLIIPHGSSWGFYTPPGTSWDKQLAPAMRPENFPLVEIYSGHGNSEEYRPWRAINFDATTETATCPESSDSYMPSCQRAGQIIHERCIAEGSAEDVCAAAAAQARSDYANMGVAGHLAVLGEATEDWLNAGQCNDCFQPPLNHRPMTSVQYGLAISNFDQGADNPLRFNWGFISSSDTHRARPGTGYKEVDRYNNTDSGGPVNETWRRQFVPEEEQLPESRFITREELMAMAGFQLTEMERQGSFWLTGGLAAVHTAGRSREEIWDAMERRETYATSGPRILLWFDLLEADGGTKPMGSTLDMDQAPIFRVRAVGAFKQKEGCPEFAELGMDGERIERLCSGECYNPADERHKITRIEIVRIQPQIFEGETVDDLITDPFLTLECPDDEAGCQVEFTDPDFVSDGRDALYYARAIQEPTMAINAENLRCEYDEAGNCVEVMPCWGDYRVPGSDDCLSPTEHRAWASPIYLSYNAPSSAGLTGALPLDDAVPAEEPADGSDDGE